MEEENQVIIFIKDKYPYILVGLVVVVVVVWLAVAGLRGEQESTEAQSASSTTSTTPTPTPAQLTLGSFILRVVDGKTELVDTATGKVVFTTSNRDTRNSVEALASISPI
jgi:hypothetical protein